jgi:Zn-dependent M28 family amino/carboxypeptidase
VIVVGAHFDKASVGDGVVDNWSGAALLPSLYESLCQHSRRHTFVFVGFAGEERGLLGSKIYVKKLTKEGRARVRAMVNIDSVGLGPTMVWTSHSDKLLLEHLLLTASFLKLTVGGVDVERVGAGDHFPFRQNKIPCAVIHSVTQETLPILHSTDDNLEAIELDDYYDTYQLLRTYLAYIDSKLEILP